MELLFLLVASSKWLCILQLLGVSGAVTVAASAACPHNLCLAIPGDDYIH